MSSYGSGGLGCLMIFLIPVVSLSSCIFGSTLVADDANTSGLNAGFTVSAIVTIVYLFLVVTFLKNTSDREKSEFECYLDSLGIIPEFKAVDGYDGIVIDRKNEKVFAGKIKDGNVFDFDEISSIEYQDKDIGNSYRYIIQINTKNFDNPSVKVTFSEYQSDLRDEAYNKLRAALNIA